MTGAFDADDALPCGCAGKTALGRVVRPARERARSRLAGSGVYLAGDLEAGLVPRTERLERVAGSVSLSDTGVERPWRGPAPDEAWGMGAVLAAPDAGRSAAAFADVLEVGYTAPPVRDRLLVAKGHSVQVVGTDRTTVALDLLRPHGSRRPGYVVGNVDVVHGFPGLDPETQAAIAGAHALNDCYAYGATTDRTLRPVVGVPAGVDRPAPERVRAWYQRALPRALDLLEPTVVRHGGRGWLFGASVTAEIDHAPPVHAGRVEPGDEVLLHRPLGAVAALAAARDRDDAPLRERALDTLQDDHAAVGAAIAATCPRVGAGDERFDPARHLKVAVDVSGPGVGGVAGTVARSGNRLHVESTPFFDRAAVRHARRNWLLPDATIGTNGPVAMIGRSAAVDRVESALRDAGVDPVRLGRVVADEGRETNGERPVSTAAGVRLNGLTETACAQPEHTAQND